MKENEDVISDFAASYIGMLILGIEADYAREVAISELKCKVPRCDVRVTINGRV